MAYIYRYLLRTQKRCLETTMNLAELDDRPLPKGWTRQKSKTRKEKYYYFNTDKGISSWKHPLDTVASHDELSLPVSFTLCVNLLNQAMNKSTVFLTHQYYNLHGHDLPVGQKWSIHSLIEQVSSSHTIHKGSSS